VSGEREQNWYPIGKVGWFTQHIREGIEVTAEQLGLLQPALAQPYRLDDATVARIIRVHRDQVMTISCCSRSKPTNGTPCLGSPRPSAPQPRRTYDHPRAAARIAADSPHPSIRIGAVTELGEWLTGSDPARSATARRHLQEVVDTDIPRVAQTARTLLDVGTAALGRSASAPPRLAPPELVRAVSTATHDYYSLIKVSQDASTEDSQNAIHHESALAGRIGRSSPLTHQPTARRPSPTAAQTRPAT
jgi:hypothetical protein